ncbi:hypothetical protein GCM10010273_48640 [Streptomyces lavendulocolor]
MAAVARPGPAAGVAGLVMCGVETWRLVRGGESAPAALDRLEAEAGAREDR